MSVMVNQGDLLTEGQISYQSCLECIGKIYHMNIQERSLKVRIFQVLILVNFADEEEEHAGD